MRGQESSSSRVDRIAGRTVENGRVTKTKYSTAPKSTPPTQRQFPTKRLGYSKDHRNPAPTGKRRRKGRVRERRRHRPVLRAVNAFTTRMKAIHSGVNACDWKPPRHGIRLHARNQDAAPRSAPAHPPRERHAGPPEVALAPER